jgi:hypothetical protein
MATFDTPNYIIGNSASITTSLSTVLTTLDQALQALQPAPSATIVKFNNTVRCDAGTSRLIEMNNTDITSIDGGVGTMTYLPSFNLPAVSNQAIQIPPFNQNPHQLVLQSAPIVLIDTLEPTTYSIPSGEIVNCYGASSGGSYIYLGCESGNIYWFNDANPSWDLLMTVNGSVRCLYFHNNTGRMYIGFKGDTMTYPYYQGNLNNICYSTSFPLLYNTIATDTWINYSNNGFNTAVNAVAGDGNYLYFAGEFTQINSGAINCNFIAVYDYNSSGNLYPFDSVNGYGFDNYVYGLSLYNDKLCATGTFTNVIITSGFIASQYCVCLTMIAGYIVNATEYLFGNPYALSNSISILDSVKELSATFYISTADNIINGNAVNYMIQAPSASFASCSVVGYNQFATPQTSFNTQYNISSVGLDQVFLLNGETKATLPFQPYLYFNWFNNRNEFIDLGNGQIYAFTGPIVNNWTLQNSRKITYQGTSWTGGWEINSNIGNGYGISTILYWNGTEYIPIATTGGSGYN